jgi:hypothetical protein
VRTTSTPTAMIFSYSICAAEDEWDGPIASGAFGHPRLWEKMMGGVARDRSHG